MLNKTTIIVPVQLELTLLSALAVMGILYIRRRMKPTYFDDGIPAISQLNFINSNHFDPKQVTLLEVFATWCGPCKEQIPHLVTLAQTYPQVNVISVSCETANVVKAFYASNEKQMQRYMVAVDGNSVMSTYMKNMRVQGIPHCFLFDRSGALVWSGHPMNCDSEIRNAQSESTNCIFMMLSLIYYYI